MEPPDSLQGYSDPRPLAKIETKKDYVFTREGRSTSIAFVFLAALSLYMLCIIGNLEIPSIEISLLGLFLVVGLIGMVFLSTFLHENTHRIVFEYFGYNTNIKYGGQAEVTYPNQWVDTKHFLTAVIAPLLVLSPVLYILFFFWTNMYMEVFLAELFLLNTVGSAKDIIDFLTLKEYGTSTLIYVNGIEEGDPTAWVSEPDIPNVEENAEREI